MPARRRRRAGTLPRCNQCRYPICWFSVRGHWRAFDPKAVDGRLHVGGAAFPIQGVQAWRRDDLITELMVSLRTTREDAEEHVYAMPWHVLHACPPDRQPQPKKD